MNRPSGSPAPEFASRLIRHLPGWLPAPVDERTIGDVYALCLGNPGYFACTQARPVNRRELLDDARALPPGCAAQDKSYLALYRSGACAALLDFVRGYPDQDTGWLGLLILARELHGQGLGRLVAQSVCASAAEMGMARVQLACYSSNEDGLRFWQHLGFQEVRRCQRTEDGVPRTLICLERRLSPVSGGFALNE